MLSGLALAKLASGLLRVSLPQFLFCTFSYTLQECFLESCRKTFSMVQSIHVVYADMAVCNSLLFLSKLARNLFCVVRIIII